MRNFFIQISKKVTRDVVDAHDDRAPLNPPSGKLVNGVRKSVQRLRNDALVASTPSGDRQSIGLIAGAGIG
jgi:hypothetical protein